MCHYLVCTSIYRPLSYSSFNPCRFVNSITIFLCICCLDLLRKTIRNGRNYTSWIINMLLSFYPLLNPGLGSRALFRSIQTQKERVQCSVYYSSPQSLIITFSSLLAQQLWGLLLKLDWLVHYIECSNVPTTYWNPQKG